MMAQTNLVCIGFMYILFLPGLVCGDDADCSSDKDCELERSVRKEGNDGLVLHLN